ncbi:MAG: sigma-70 family RNA polymerase sigma factor [Planctomycetota bacterium]
MAMLPGTTDRLFRAYCRSGDPRALGRVFDRTAPELMRVALYLCGDRVEAEDLLQRTFLLAIERRAAFDATQRCLPWLCGILANHARQLQRRRAQAAARTATGDPDDVAGRERAPDATAIDRELRAALGRLRQELGAPYAEVLDLHLERGFTARDIAAQLGRPPGTVRTQLMRALRLLRQRLPRGFVAGMLPPSHIAGWSAFGSGLTAVKAAVLDAATAAAPGAALATPTLTIAGGLVMSKKLALAVPAALLLLAVGLHQAGWWDESVPTPEPARPTASAPAPAQPDAALGASDAAAGTRQPATATAAAARSADPALGDLLLVTTWSDERPASGIGVGGHPELAANERRLGVTDREGRCLLTHLTPGRWLLRVTHHLDRIPVTVLAGEVRTVRVQVDRAATLRGCVVDDRGQGVAGATIWFAMLQDPSRQFPCTTAAADGSFEVPLPRQPVQVGARAAGHAPSLAVEIDHDRANEALVLQLRGRGAELRGTVRDRTGRPVPGARVLIGPAATSSTDSAGTVQPWGREVRTDPDGRYTAEGLRPGRDIVQAWAPGFAVALQTIDLPIGRSSCDLALEDGAVVAGRTVDDAGRAVAGARVTLADLGVEDGGRFVSCSAVSANDGAFRVVDLPAGRHVLQARGPDNRQKARARATLELRPGAVTEWRAVLVPLPRILGLVLGEDGTPMGGLRVAICDVTGAPVGAAMPVLTDATGRFELQPDDPDPVCLAISYDDAPPMHIVENVQPGPNPHEIRLAHLDLAIAQMRGRVVDDAGRPLAASVTVSRRRQAQPKVTAAGADGTFGLASLSAGRYRVHVTCAAGALTLPEFWLGSSKRHDLGDLVFARPGAAVVTVRAENGAPARGQVTLHTADGGFVASAPVDASGTRFGALQPGDYLVSCGGAPFAAAGALRVESDATALLDLQLQRVGYADVRADGAAAAAPGGPSGPGDGQLLVVARRADGGHAGIFSSMTPGHTRVWLPPGRYLLECRADDGGGAAARTGTAELQIDGLGHHPTVAVTLR